MQHLVILCIALMVGFLPTVSLADQPTVLVVPKGVREAFWGSVRQGAKDAAEKRGVEMVFRGPVSEKDPFAQLEILREGVDNGVDAIVLAPGHTTRTVPILKEAVEKGIPVILIDSDMHFEGRTSLVASDNYRAGQQAAEHLISGLNKGDSVLMLRYKEDNASTLAREQGFLDGLAGLSPEVTVIDAGYVGSTIGEAFHRALTMLAEHPEIKGLFTPNESSTLGGGRALVDSGRAGKVRFIGFDDTLETRKGLRTGVIQGVILQQPYQMGYQGVMAACDALEGKPVRKRIVTETSFKSSDGDVVPNHSD